MKRTLSAGLVLFGSALLLQGPASAHVTNLTIDSVAYQKVDGSVVISGTITCTAGERFRVGANLTQDQGTTDVEANKLRADQGDCTGAPTPYRFNMVPDDNTESFNTTDPATVQVVGESGFTGTNNRHGISESETAPIDIQPQP